MNTLDELEAWLGDWCWVLGDLLLNGYTPVTNLPDESPDSVIKQTQAEPKTNETK